MYSKHYSKYKHNTDLILHVETLLSLEKSILEFLNSIKEGQKSEIIYQQIAEIIDFDQMFCNLQQHFLSPPSKLDEMRA